MNMPEDLRPIITFECCEKHNCLESKVNILSNEKKFWHKLLASKWSYIIIPAIFMAIVGWGGWVTKAIYAKDVEKKEIATICSDIQEIKEDNKEREKKREQEKKDEQGRREEDKKEQVRVREEDRKERDRKDRENTKILLDILRQIKK